MDRFVGLALVAAGCAPLPDDPYQRSLAENDRASTACDVIDGVVMSGSQNAACQARIAGKRQQIVAEEMQRRQEEATREQTQEMKKAIEANAEQQPAESAPLQWCIMIVDGSKALEGCFPDRAECNRVWGDIRASGKATTDCEHRAPTVQPTAAPAASGPPAGTKWCTNVRVDGGTVTESCYPDQDGCNAARSFHRDNASSCVFK